MPNSPSQEVLHATTSGVGVSKSPRKTTAIYTKTKTKTRNWEKSEYMNPLKCLLRADKKESIKNLGK